MQYSQTYTPNVPFQVILGYHVSGHLEYDPCGVTGILSDNLHSKGRQIVYQ